MFFPQLLEIENYNILSDFIEEFDTWLAHLPKSKQDRITASRVSIKFSIDYSLCESLLENCCHLGILEHIYAITCPNPKCQHTLKISSESSVYDDIHTTNYCYNCDNEDFTITDNDIYIMYKLIAKPTNSPNNYKNSNKSSSNNFQLSHEQTLKNFFHKGFLHPSNFLYCPNEEEKKMLKTLYNNLEGPFENNKAKGDSLEDLAIYLLNLVKPFNANKDSSNSTNQLDCQVTNSTCFPTIPHILNDIGGHFSCECKNEKKTPGNSYFLKFLGILRNTHASFGIFFSALPMAKTCSELAREEYLRDKILLINITTDDIKDIIFKNINFLDVIEKKCIYIKTKIPQKNIANL